MRRISLNRHTLCYSGKNSRWKLLEALQCHTEISPLNRFLAQKETKAKAVEEFQEYCRNTNVWRQAGPLHEEQQVREFCVNNRSYQCTFNNIQNPVFGDERRHIKPMWKQSHDKFIRKEERSISGIVAPHSCFSDIRSVRSTDVWGPRVSNVHSR